jgi:hypothetical protein
MGFEQASDSPTSCGNGAFEKAIAEMKMEMFWRACDVLGIEVILDCLAKRRVRDEGGGGGTWPLGSVDANDNHGKFYDKFLLNAFQHMVKESLEEEKEGGETLGGGEGGGVVGGEQGGGGQGGEGGGGGGGGGGVGGGGGGGRDWGGGGVRWLLSVPSLLQTKEFYIFWTLNTTWTEKVYISWDYICCTQTY